jgi:hypothetical protein
LNARFDSVGVHLRGYFAVDQEYLDLPPVGCSNLIPNPSCAHGSYFNPQNVLVNRDLFASSIERGSVCRRTSNAWCAGYGLRVKERPISKALPLGLALSVGPLKKEPLWLGP